MHLRKLHGDSHRRLITMNSGRLRTASSFFRLGVDISIIKRCKGRQSRQRWYRLNSLRFVFQSLGVDVEPTAWSNLLSSVDSAFANVCVVVSSYPTHRSCKLSRRISRQVSQVTAPTVSFLVVTASTMVAATLDIVFYLHRRIHRLIPE